MARVTREIMDAKDTYQAFVVARSPEEQVQMKTMLDEQVAELEAEMQVLKSERIELINSAFDEAAQ